MTELKLFPEVGEEIDLSMLRAEVMRIYDRAFSTIRLKLHQAEHFTSSHGLAMEVLAICEEVVEQTDALAQKHRDKYNKREPQRD